MNSICKDVKIFHHHTNLSKADEFDKSEITRTTTITTTTTIKSFLRPLPQYMLAVKNFLFKHGRMGSAMPTEIWGRARKVHKHRLFGPL